MAEDEAGELQFVGVVSMEGKDESTDPKTKASIRGHVCTVVHGCWSKYHPGTTEKDKLTGALTPIGRWFCKMDVISSTVDQLKRSGGG